LAWSKHPRQTLDNNRTIRDTTSLLDEFTWMKTLVESSAACGRLNIRLANLPA